MTFREIQFQKCPPAVVFDPVMMKRQKIDFLNIKF